MNIDIPKAEGDKLLAYMSGKGKSGENTIKVLGAGLHFLEAFNTQVGFELLKDLVTMHEELLLKVGKLEASDEEKMKYQVVSELVDRWSARIKQYLEQVKRVNEFKGESPNNIR